MRYTKDHEWVRMDGDVAVVGVSEHAQEQLGDVVFVELPDKGAQVSPGDNMAVVESVKAASEVYAPISGEVVEVNSELEEKPALVNESPEAEGWFVKIRPSAPDELEALMDRDAYEAYLATLD